MKNNGLENTENDNQLERTIIIFFINATVACASRAERSVELTAVFSGECSKKCIETILNTSVHVLNE